MSDEKVLTPEAKRQGRADLLQLLLLILVGVGIIYFSLEIGVGLIGLGIWFISIFRG